MAWSAWAVATQRISQNRDTVSHFIDHARSLPNQHLTASVC